ncbi:uncharacterized protein [Dysidea avara]|uniref:uncharacterized protein n=1 Tax=Dysidea avara TaxID=196820 RepID=UPI0033248266
MSKKVKQLNSNTIFFDTGGQPEYIALLPAINSVPTINFVIHDLTKKLVDPVLIRYKRAECEEAPSYILHYSNLEMIQLLICLITDSLEQRIVQLPNCIGIPEQSYIGFVGTHYDKVKDDREVLQNVNDLLTCVIKEKSNLRVLSPGNSVIFPVDNTTAGNPETEDPTIKIVRGQIGDLINETKPKELPINWMILQVALQDLHAHKYITYEEYRTIARENASITDEEEVKASLSYFHILGIVVYFGVAELHNIIVTDVKWLFTNLGKIMHLTPKEIKCLDYHLMEKFKKQRLLAKRLLKKIDLGVNEMYYLFNTLVHLKIIATVIIEGVEYYYLPCGLSSTIQYIDRCRFHLSEPLLVQFSSGFLPRGFFSSLVVHLLEQLPQNWTPQFCSNTKHFNNVMTFLLPDETFLRLHDHTYYLEVSVRHFKRDVKASYHHVVLPVLKTYLHRVCRQLNFNLQRLQYGFLCHGDYDTDDHIVTLKTLKVSTPSQLKCSRQPSHTTVIGESHTAWFKKSTDLPLPSRIQNDTSESETSTLLPPLDSMSTLSWQDKKPVMGDLNKIIVPRILASWDDVAYALRYEVHTVNSLREKGHNPKKCCQKLFEDWLTTSNGASPKTYSTLLSKLREVEELTEGIDEIVQKVSKL